MQPSVRQMGSDLFFSYSRQNLELVKVLSFILLSVGKSAPLESIDITFSCQDQ